MSRHAALMKAVCAKYSANTRGFRNAVAAAMRDAANDDENPEDVFREAREFLTTTFHRLPDCYRIGVRDSDEGPMLTLDVWEVVVSHRLKDAKLAQYGDLYLWLYDWDVRFNLYEVDHHGREKLILGDDRGMDPTEQLVRWP